MEFIAALKDGLRIFLHWELYVVVISYILVCSIFDILPKKKDLSVIGNSESGRKKSIVTRIIESLIHILATTCLVVILSPIILGISESANWFYPIELVTNRPIIVVVAICLFLVLEYSLGIIPIVGQHKTIHNLVYGGITIIYILVDLDQNNIVAFNKSAIIVPTNFELLWFVLFSIFSLWFSVLVSALIISKSYKKRFLPVIVPACITVIGCFLPVFIYGAWIGNKI